MRIAVPRVEAARAVVEVRDADEEVPRPREDHRLEVGEQRGAEAAPARRRGHGEQLEVVATEEARPDQRQAGHAAVGHGDESLAARERRLEEPEPVRPRVAEPPPRVGVEERDRRVAVPSRERPDRDVSGGRRDSHRRPG